MTTKFNEYVVNVRIKGYNLAMDMKVPARNPDEAFDLACGQEFRFQDDDKYVLLVLAEDDEFSALCTYETFDDANDHIKMFTSGIWMLIRRTEDGEGLIVRECEELKNDEDDNEEIQYQ